MNTVSSEPKTEETFSTTRSRSSFTHELPRGQTGDNGPSGRKYSRHELSQLDHARQPSRLEPFQSDFSRRQILSTQYNSCPRPKSTSTSSKVATTVESKSMRPISRVKISRAPLGDMSRTYVEGMVPHTEYRSAHPNSVGDTKVDGLVPASEYENKRDRQKTYPANTDVGAFKSRAPSHAKSIFQNLQDERYASRQTTIASMAPEERRRQEVWAQSMIKRAGVCPQGFTWRRIDIGYVCEGRHHIITDELIAEGKGGVLVLPAGKMRMQPQWGPYYQDPNDPRGFVFEGDPDDNHPEWINNSTGEIHWDKAWRVAGLSSSPETPKEMAKFEDALAEQVFGHRYFSLFPSDSEGSSVSGGALRRRGLAVIFKGKPVAGGIMTNRSRTYGLRTGPDFAYNNGQRLGRMGLKVCLGEFNSQAKDCSQRY